MQFFTENGKGDSLDNPIVIDASDTISGVIIEHGYVDQVIEFMGGSIKSIEQNLVFEDGRQFDRIVLTLNDGSEKVLIFDVTSFFRKVKFAERLLK